MEWIEKLPSDPEALRLIIMVIMAATGLFFIRGKNAQDPTQGLLKLANDQLAINREQLGEIKELRIANIDHEKQEQRRENQDVSRHENIMLILQNMISAQTGTNKSIDALTVQIDKGVAASHELKTTLEGDKFAGRLAAMRDTKDQIDKVIKLLEGIERRLSELDKNIDVVKVEVISLRYELDNAKDTVKKTITQEVETIDSELGKMPRKDML